MEANLVYCSGIARGETILAEFSADYSTSLDFPSMASKCLAHIPPFHSRFSFTACDLMFVCILDSGITYFAIVDESLQKWEAFKLLQDVRREFRRYVREKDADPKSVGKGWAQKHMRSKMQQIAEPIMGMPQKQKREQEEKERERQQNESVSNDATSAFTDIGPSSLVSWGGRNGEDDYVTVPIHTKTNQNLEEGHTEGHHEIKSSISPQSSISKHSNKEWRSRVWMIVALDIIICLTLLGIWLGVCSGFQCINGSN